MWYRRTSVCRNTAASICSRGGSLCVMRLLIRLLLLLLLRDVRMREFEGAHQILDVHLAAKSEKQQATAEQQVSNELDMNGAHGVGSPLCGESLY